MKCENCDAELDKLDFVKEGTLVRLDNPDGPSWEDTGQALTEYFCPTCGAYVPNDQLSKLSITLQP